jgi:hypothetical protein
MIPKSVLNQLACSLGRRDEVPNQELARRLADSEDQAGIREVAAGLKHQSGEIQADCIKVLYEVGYIKPNLVAPYALDFLALLKSSSNRLVWGGMIALSTVGVQEAAELFPYLDEIQQAMESGSVITRDNGVLTLSRIASTDPRYNRVIFPYLINHLSSCRPKDVPQHAEKTLPAVTSDNKTTFLLTLEKRKAELPAAQRKRVEQVIKQAERKVKAANVP